GNDDNPPAIAISNASVLEGDLGDTGTAVFTVSLSNPSQETLTVTYSTADDTATSGGDVAAGEGDYVPLLNETLVFNPGETTKLITVTVNGDGLDEGDETFNVVLGGVTGDATLPVNPGIGTIVDNDAPPAIAINNVTVQEGDSGDLTNAVFTVQLDRVGQEEITVDYSTANGTANAGGDVNAGTDDYQPLTGTLTFAPGETTALITVTVNGDDVDEIDETFTVTLNNPSGDDAVLSIGGSVGTGTIADDDDQAAIAILGTSVLEGDTTTTTSAIFTVQLSNPSQTDISVDYNTTDGSASALG
ncbi:Calx-beta domain-containing protein, partial [Leptolyngbya sp. CCY15150]|uniref:Calx-beta domain-containing protein n=1 Tax=Leptolyngbya sp. CCY15150 TaxID=2767772 RepID=UPI0023B23A16